MLYFLLAAAGLADPTGNCSAGWYCTGQSYMAQPINPANSTNMCSCPDTNFTGGECWPGTFCPSGANYPVNCTGGYYCDQYGLSTPTGPCDAGKGFKSLSFGVELKKN